MSKGRVAAALGAGVLALTIPIVTHFEGEELDPYRDVVGVWTVCYGDTKNVEQRRHTKEECAQRLLTSLAEHNAGLGCITVPMADHVHAAVLSWAYNVGTGAACRSTLVRKLNAGDVMGACAELSRWVMAAGKTYPGLVRRRNAERKLCEGA